MKTVSHLNLRYSWNVLIAVLALWCAAFAYAAVQAVVAPSHAVITVTSAPTPGQ